MTGWIVLAVVLVFVGVDWYWTRKWWQLIRGWRDACKEWEKTSNRWRKLLKNEQKISKRWRDLYRGRNVAFIPSCWPEDVELPEGRWEFVEVTTTEGEGAPTETTTGEEKP